MKKLWLLITLYTVGLHSMPLPIPIPILDEQGKLTYESLDPQAKELFSQVRWGDMEPVNVTQLVELKNPQVKHYFLTDKLEEYNNKRGVATRNFIPQLQNDVIVPGPSRLSSGKQYQLVNKAGKKQLEPFKQKK